MFNWFFRSNSSLFRDWLDNNSYNEQLSKRIISSLLFTFVFPFTFTIVWILILDSYMGYDHFVQKSISENMISSKGHSSENIIIFEYDNNFNEKYNSSPKREDIFELAKKVIDKGAKLVILDYVFLSHGEGINIEKEYLEKIIIGSKVFNVGNISIDVPLSLDLNEYREVLNGNWGHVQLNDTLDRYGKIYSINHLTSDEDIENPNRTIWPSISTVAYSLGELNISGSELRSLLIDKDYNSKKIGNISKVNPNSSQLILFPYLPQYFESRSAWWAEYTLKDSSLIGKYVFISDTWNRSKDHYSIGASTSNELLDRGLSTMNLISRSAEKSIIPGVFAQASALENLINGDIINLDRNVYVVLLDIFVFLIVYYIIFSL
ncbi:CHASE2 domain-containing protein, partial [Vibrio nigripulchritudo]